MTEPSLLWIGFNLFVLAMLAVDLGVFHRKAHVVTFRESVAWTRIWVVLSLLRPKRPAGPVASAQPLA